MFHSVFSINAWHKQIVRGDLYNLTQKYMFCKKIISQDIRAPSHKGQEKCGHRAKLSSFCVIPCSSPYSSSGPMPQQLSARGGEFFEPGIDSKNILNDLNCHQDVGPVMALQISKFQIKPIWLFEGSLEISLPYFFFTVTLIFPTFYTPTFSLDIFLLPWTLSVVHSTLEISDFGCHLLTSLSHLLLSLQHFIPCCYDISRFFSSLYTDSPFYVLY